MNTISIGSTYQHYKGTKVTVLATALHSETKEPLVIYIHLEDGQIWARPVKMFLEEMKSNGNKIKRFSLIK